MDINFMRYTEHLQSTPNLKFLESYYKHQEKTPKDIDWQNKQNQLQTELINHYGVRIKRLAHNAYRRAYRDAHSFTQEDVEQIAILKFLELLPNHKFSTDIEDKIFPALKAEVKREIMGLKGRGITAANNIQQLATFITLRESKLNLKPTPHDQEEIDLMARKRILDTLRSADTTTAQATVNLARQFLAKAAICSELPDGEDPAALIGDTGDSTFQKVLQKELVFLLNNFIETEFTSEEKAVYKCLFEEDMTAIDAGKN
jgi:DNA-directed RNA polymerase specialized sigma subunit